MPREGASNSALFLDRCLQRLALREDRCRRVLGALREIQANPALGMTHSQFELAPRPDSGSSARLRAPWVGAGIRPALVSAGFPEHDALGAFGTAFALIPRRVLEKTLSRACRHSPAARNRIPQARAGARLALGRYGDLVGGIGNLLEDARRTSARAVNAILTATYWEIGRRIVEYEQQGKSRAEYGEALLERLGADLTRRYGRGFGVVNLSQMKKLYLLWPAERILQTPSEESSAGHNRRTPPGKSDTAILQTASAESALAQLAVRFPLLELRAADREGIIKTLDYLMANPWNFRRSAGYGESRGQYR